MEKEVNNIRLQSSFFAKLKQGKAINGIEDMVISVKNRGHEWENAVSENSQNRVSMMLKSIEECEEMKRLTNEEENLVMPVMTMENREKLYIVANLKKPEMLGPAVDMLNGDANKILNIMMPHDREMVEHADRGSKGATPVAFMGMEEMEAYRDARDTMKYSERQELKKSIVSIAKRMRSKDMRTRTKAEIEYAQVMAALSDKEKSQLILTLLMHNGTQAELDEKLIKVLDRDEMGKKTQFGIEVRWKEPGEAQIFITKSEEMEKYLDLSSHAATIYVLNLIQAKIGKYEVYQLEEKKYRNAYELVVGTSFDGNYNNLKKRINDSYNEIEIKLAEIFNDLGEDYSPYMVNRLMPIVLSKEKIKITEQLDEIIPVSQENY